MMAFHKLTMSHDSNDSQSQENSTNISRDDEQEESLSTKAKETGQIFKDLVASLGKRTKTVAEEKSRKLKEAADDRDIATSDASDIQMLGSYIDSIITIFDNTMDRITQQPYDEQQKLLVGLKKMLQEEVYVIDAGLNMAKRLKFLESPATKSTHDKVEERVQERITIDKTDTEAIAPPMSEEADQATSGFAAKEEASGI